MPLPASGAITMAQIQTEFGGANPISLSEYYGASYTLPASGAISFNQFYGLRGQFIITEGTLNADNKGYSSGSYGSIAGITTCNGKTITGIAQGRSLIKGSYIYIFSVAVSGSPTETHWTSLYIYGYGTILRSSRSSFTAGTTGTWTFSINVSGIDGVGKTWGYFI